MKNNLNVKKIIIAIMMVIIAISSIFGVSKVASSTQFHEKTIKSLDDKKLVVMEITAATAGTATALAAIPGDSTTPLANQILKLSSYLVIVIGAIFLEKILLTLTGYATFTFIIPVACILFGIYLFAEKEILKKLAIKLSIFGIIIFMVVPISVKMSNLIEESYKSTINQTVEEAKNTENIAENSEQQEEKKEGWNGIVSNIKEGISNAGDTVSNAIESGKKMMSKFVDAIAVLIITTCVIPIVVLVFLIWIVKMIFGLDIPSFKIKKDKKIEE